MQEKASASLSSSIGTYNTFKNTLKFSTGLLNNHIEISERKLSFIDILKLVFFIKSKSIDIIHAHGKGAGFISRLIKPFVRKPLIYSFHGIHLEQFAT